MKEVLAFIEVQKEEYTNLPLFQFLDDKSIAPKQRLGFAPCIAHFIMSFGDLNKYVFREKETVTKAQQIINEHTLEDDHHWPWFVTDLEKLGFNQNMSFTQVLRFLWSEQTKVSRQLSYFLSAYTLQADPIMKIIAIEAIEATGNVLFSRTAKIASELTAVTQQDYIYFGEFHFNLETGHAMGEHEGEEYLKKIELTDVQRIEAYELVKKIFNIFTDWTNELLAYAQKQIIEEENRKQTSSALVHCG